jgi:hypothetical protein
MIMSRTVSPEKEQIRQIIRAVVLPLKEAGAHIHLDYVSDHTYLELDSSKRSPAIIKYLAMPTIKEIVRSELRHDLDPVEAAQNAIDSGQTVMFSGLQDYYGVNRPNGEGGKARPQWVPRHDLSLMEVQSLCNRMRSAGDALHEHADALMADYIQAHAA